MRPFNCGGWHYGKNWYDKAITLKNASDKILDAYLEAQDHIVNRFDSAPDGVPVEFTKLDFVDLDQYPVFMLLMGYSIENLFCRVPNVWTLYTPVRKLHSLLTI